MKWVTILLLALSFSALATPPKNRPPENRPPDRGGDHVNESTTQSSSTSASEATSASASQSKATGGTSQAAATGGAAQASLINIGGEGGAGTRSTDGDGLSVLSPSSESSVGNIEIGTGSNNGDTITYRYDEPPIAMAGYASGPVDIDCRTIYGFDFRGADKQNAGGATFGIPGPVRQDCKFDKAAVRGFTYGDYEAGWNAFCMIPTNWQTEIEVDAFRRELPPRKKKFLGIFGKRDDFGRINQAQAVTRCLGRHRTVVEEGPPEPTGDAVAVEEETPAEGK